MLGARRNRAPYFQRLRGSPMKAKSLQPQSAETPHRSRGRWKKKTFKKALVGQRRRSYLIAKSHFSLIPRSSHTRHHSSSTESPTLIRPSRNHPDLSLSWTTLIWKVSRCHKKSVRRDCTKFWTAKARDDTDVLSESDSGGYKA
jgi:hypothetical protein